MVLRSSSQKRRKITAKTAKRRNVFLGTTRSFCVQTIDYQKLAHPIGCDKIAKLSGFVWGFVVWLAELTRVSQKPYQFWSSTLFIVPQAGKYAQ